MSFVKNVHRIRALCNSGRHSACMCRALSPQEVRQLHAPNRLNRQAVEKEELIASQLQQVAFLASPSIDVASPYMQH